MKKKIFENPSCEVRTMVCEDIMTTSGWLTSNLGFIFEDGQVDAGYEDSF